MNEEAGLVESWWENKLRMELAGQKHRITSAMLFELKEARIALMMEEPNVQMALTRINRMISDLEK